ncbi:MAG: division/cell wall cluster transcriptional repressor MraZ [Ectothiorhodospiraceae bacterium]|nr:division/cell wall cluster transcriptional repressor MraZ [Ectothiorhodospiraceae bacterium]
MTGFKGKYEYSIDTKGRLNLPAKMRKHMMPEANGTFVITRGMENCLYLYPLDTWSKVESELREKLNVYREEDRLFLRTLLMWAHEVTLDKQSRIMIPQELLEFASLDSSIVIIGALDKIELWAPAELEKYLGKFAEQSYEEVAARVMGGIE